MFDFQVWFMQFVIYKEMRERFSSHIWLDVVSKCDLLQASPVIFATDDCNVDNFELVRYRKMGPDGALNVSVKNEIGLHEVPFCSPSGILLVIFSLDTKYIAYEHLSEIGRELLVCFYKDLILYQQQRQRHKHGC